MTASFAPPQEVFIGAFAFDAERRQLIGEGGAVELPLKEFELLSLLVEKRPRAVSKDEIRDALWPRTIVTEASLTSPVHRFPGSCAERPRSSSCRPSSSWDARQACRGRSTTLPFPAATHTCDGMARRSSSRISGARTEHS